MAVAEMQAEQTVEQRVALITEELADRCVAKQLPPSDSITTEDLEALDAEEARFILRIGAIKMVGDELHRRRSDLGEEPEAKTTGPRRNPPHSASGRNPTFWRGLGISVVGADHALKPLLEFKGADLAYLAETSGVHREAYARREAWAKGALKELKKHKAGAVRELPAEVLAALDESAETAWGR